MSMPKSDLGEMGNLFGPVILANLTARIKIEKEELRLLSLQIKKRQKNNKKIAFHH